MGYRRSPEETAACGSAQSWKASGGKLSVSGVKCRVAGWFRLRLSLFLRLSPGRLASLKESAIVL